MLLRMMHWNSSLTCWIWCCIVLVPAWLTKVSNPPGLCLDYLTTREWNEIHVLFDSNFVFICENLCINAETSVNMLCYVTLMQLLQGKWSTLEARILCDYVTIDKLIVADWLLLLLLIVRLQRKEHISHTSTTQSLIFKILVRSWMQQSKYLQWSWSTCHSCQLGCFLIQWQHLLSGIYLLQYSCICSNFWYMTSRVEVFDLVSFYCATLC